MRYACVAVAAVLIAAPPLAAGNPQEDSAAARERVQVQSPEDATAKEELAARILDAAERRSGNPWSEGPRTRVKNALLSRTLKELSDASALAGDRAIDILMGFRNPETNTLGSLQNDWVFTPVPTCRILDTRPGSGVQGDGSGPYTAGSVHTFDVASGAATCGIPFPDAKAAVLNFVAASAAGNGNLRVWPYDSTLPAAPGTAVLNFTAGFNTSNYVVQPICNTATATGGNCPEGLFIEPFVNSTHVIVDTVGYFAAPLATALECTTVSENISLPAGVGQTDSVSTACTAGYTLTGGGIYAGAGTNSIIMNKVDFNTNSVFCRATNNTAGAVTAQCEARCCRVPGR